MAVSFLRLGKFGRLGNQLFQIASTIGVSKKNKCAYVFPHWEYSKYFKTPLPQFGINRPTFDVLSEKNYHYDEYALNPDNHYDLQGYFQSEKYWEHCKEEALRYFEFNEDIPKPYYTVGSGVCVSVHVRRGDYLGLSDYHTNLTLDYYNEALKLFPYHNVLFFSDDIKWCKENFNGARYLFKEGSEIEDLSWMANCHHNIISNSTFSWWGAYLNKNPNKKVVAPKNWFGEKNKHVDTKDLYCKDWILI